MKLTVLGVKRIQGLSKANSSPFDMCRLMAMVPIDVTAGERLTVTGHGFELAELELDPASMGQFAACKFPVTLDLTTDSRPFRGKFETVVTGFIAAARTAA